MATWTVAFDSTFSVFDIEADTQEEAERKAEEAIKGIDEVINASTEGVKVTAYGLTKSIWCVTRIRRKKS